MAKIKPNDKCPCGSGKKYKKCCREKGPSIMVNQEDQYSLSHLRQDHTFLLQTLIEILKKNETIGNPKNIPWLAQAHDNARKIITHILTIDYISYSTKPKNITLMGKQVSFIDYSSVWVLVRTAFESYLVFNQNFITPESDEQRGFMYLVRYLHALDERMKVPASSTAAEINRREKLGEITDIKKKISDHIVYKRLDNKNRRLALKGKWRLKKNWLDLAVDAGISRNFFNAIYSILSQEAHSGIASMTRSRNARTKEEQEEKLIIALKVNLTVMGNLIIDYGKLIPEEQFSLDNRARLLAIVWKKVGADLYDEKI